MRHVAVGALVAGLTVTGESPASADELREHDGVYTGDRRCFRDGSDQVGTIAIAPTVTSEELVGRALHYETIRRDPWHVETHDQPLALAAKQGALEVYSFVDGAGVHLIVPVDGQASFRDARTTGESLCGHAHVVLPPPVVGAGASALVMTAEPPARPEAERRVLVIAASLSRLSRDATPRLAITIYARPVVRSAKETP